MSRYGSAHSAYLTSFPGPSWSLSGKRSGGVGLPVHFHHLGETHRAESESVGVAQRNESIKQVCLMVQAMLIDCFTIPSVMLLSKLFLNAKYTKT